MHTEQIRKLGLVFGRPDDQFVTTFGDDGIPEPSSLRMAYRHIMPTTLGFLAGATKLLLDPWVVHALQVALAKSGRSLFEHLVDILKVNLAAVYGDEATLRSLTELITTTHRRRFLAADQPDWFVATTGVARDFRPHDEHLMRATTMTIAAAIGRAHHECGLLTPGDMGVGYGQDLMSTIGRVSGLPRPIAPFNTFNLQRADIDRTLPLMNNAQLRTAGVPALLMDVLDSTIDNQTVGELAQLFVGFMHDSDREALDLTWTTADQQKLDAWTAGYAKRTSAGKPFGLTSGDLFEVSFRGVPQEQ
ncbi:MAG TPA: hypothetical protein VM581_03890 [Magnetospirillaceae bacterium]|nr:hypothetical protein [Magnetospirillaceae bacterium]